MKKMLRYFLLIMLVTALFAGCNKKQDETKEPVATTEPPATLKPEYDNEGTGVPTGDDEENDNTQPEEVYNNELIFEPVEECSASDIEKAITQIYIRAGHLGITDMNIADDETKIVIRYNNDDETAMIRLLAASGDVVFKNGLGNVILSNDDILKVNVSTDDENPEFRKMEVELTPTGTESFKEYTTQRDEDELILSCNGKELMKITFGQPVTDGRFVLSNIPKEELIYNAISAYVVSEPVISFEG